MPARSVRPDPRCLDANTPVGLTDGRCSRMRVPRTFRERASMVAAPLVAVLVGTGIWMATPPSADAAASDITFNGRGFGHGRGMSQWGAYGYAVDYGSNYQGILQHYYGNTSHATDAGNPGITVELMAWRGRETVITGGGLAVNGIPLGRGSVLIKGVGSHTSQVLVGDGCGGPWSVWTGAANGVVSGRSTVTGEINLCDGGTTRNYKGAMHVLDGGGYLTTVNELPVDDYLKG